MTTFATAAAVGEREQLADIIYRIDPAETPIFSNVKKKPRTASLPSGKLQESASASTTNFHNEGANTATAAALITTSRIGTPSDI